MGRLFDAAAAIAGVRQAVNYEAQAAIEFEALADPAETGCYSFGYEAIRDGGSTQKLTIDPKPLIKEMVDDLRIGVSLPVISARFHNGVASMVCEVVKRLAMETGIAQVVLSGGVWQNMTLLTKSLSLLRGAGFEVFIHSLVPANDGGLALGQAVIALNRLKVDR
jgi:hydrogenase maturation protein HypF